VEIIVEIGKETKSIIRKALLSIGLEVRKKDARRSSLAECLKHVSFKGFSPGTILDVGVGKGTSGLYDTFSNAEILLVEPLEEFDEAIGRICKKYNAKHVRAVACSTEGCRTIHVHPRLTGSSICCECEGKKADGIPREVPGIILDRVCREQRLSPPFLIKIDAQGAELDVLEGAQESLKQTELVILEVSFFEFFLEAPTLYEILVYMKEHGFVAYDIYGGTIRPLDGALAQIDMIFVKEKGMFRTTHVYASPQQRELMNS